MGLLYLCMYDYIWFSLVITWIQVTAIFFYEQCVVTSCILSTHLKTKQRELWRGGCGGKLLLIKIFKILEVLKYRIECKSMKVTLLNLHWCLPLAFCMYQVSYVKVNQIFFFFFSLVSFQYFFTFLFCISLSLEVWHFSHPPGNLDPTCATQKPMNFRSSIV